MALTKNFGAQARAAAPRAPLDRELISRTALELVDQHGIEQLSMRKLGAALGVEAMALYHHFNNKAELLDGILDNLLARMELSVTDSGTPLERIRAICLALRQVAFDHPQIYLLLLERRLSNMRALNCHERMLKLLRQCGLNDRQGAGYLQILANFTIGGALADIGQRATAGSAADLQQLNDSFHLGLALIFQAVQMDLDLCPPEGRQPAMAAGR